MTFGAGVLEANTLFQDLYLISTASFLSTV